MFCIPGRFDNLSEEPDCEGFFLGMGRLIPVKPSALHRWSPQPSSHHCLRNTRYTILQQVTCEDTYYAFIAFDYTPSHQLTYASKGCRRSRLAANTGTIDDSFRCQYFFIGYFFNNTIALFNYTTSACIANRVANFDS